MYRVIKKEELWELLLKRGESEGAAARTGSYDGTGESRGGWRN